MSSLANDLAALIAAREAATKGPWFDCVWDPMEAPHVARVEGAHHPKDDIARRTSKPDAAFIALAANVIEAHGAELAALIEENARLRAALETIIEADDTWQRSRLGSDALALVRAGADTDKAIEQARAALRGPS